MSANITDYFNKASSMNGSYPPVATVTAARSTGGSTLSCDDLSGWATDTPVHFSTFKVNTDGTIDTTTQTDWKGIVSGNTITEMTRLAGAADSGNASGDRVELNPTIGWLDDLVTGLLVSHKQNGALKDNAVTESSIATGAVTSSKVAAGAISSYDKIADDVIQARNIADETITADKIDWETVRVELFTGSSNGEITLSDEITNYDYLEIEYTYYGSGGGAKSVMKITTDGNDFIMFAYSFENATRMNIMSKLYDISGKKLTPSVGMEWYNVWGSSGVTAGQTTSKGYIKKVVGIKCS